MFNLPSYPIAKALCLTPFIRKGHITVLTLGLPCHKVLMVYFTMYHLPQGRFQGGGGGGGPGSQDPPFSGAPKLHKEEKNTTF